MSITHLVVDGRPVRLRPTRLLPRGTDAMTLPWVILIRAEHLGSATLLLHETVHVRQWRRYGTVGFLRRYLADYLRGRMNGLGHHQAYRDIRFEVDARDLVARFCATGD